MKITDVSQSKARDTGLALILILLLISYFGNTNLLIPAIILLIIAMSWPKLFSPLVPIWFGFSHILGTIVSRFIFTLIFLLILTPVGLVRKALGRDPMKLKKWKKSKDSVFSDKVHHFNSAEMEKPY